MLRGNKIAYWVLNPLRLLGHHVTFRPSATAPRRNVVNSRFLARTGKMFVVLFFICSGILVLSNTASATVGATVTFVQNAGSDPSLTASQTSQGSSGMDLTLVANLTPAFSNPGFNFNYWSTQPGGGGTQYADGAYYSFSSDLTLYAQWIGPNHTVTFYENANPNDSKISDEVRNSPSALTPIQTLGFTNPNYSFGEWATSPNGGGQTYLDGAIYGFQSAASLYAQWIPDSESVSFSANTGVGSVPTLTESFGSVVTLPTGTTLAKPNYLLVGWNTAADGSGTEFALGSQITVPTSETLYAQWSADSETLLFSANGGTGVVSPLDFVYGKSVTLPMGQPLLKAGNILSGWNTAADGSGTEFGLGTSGIFTTSETLYAQWSADSETVTFSSNGGSGSIAPISTTYGNTVPLPQGESLSRAGYTLVGWNTEPSGSGTEYGLGATVPVTNAQILYATWSRDYFEVTMKVPGSELKSVNISVASGSTIRLRPAPGQSRPGYSFAGWFTEAHGGHLVGQGGASFTPTKSTAIYARWTQNHKVVLAFSVNGGAGNIASQRVSMGMSVDIPGGKSFHRSGFTFLGWATNPRDKSPTERAGVELIVKHAETLYAVWRRATPVATAQVLLGNIGTFAPNSSVISTPMLHSIAVLALNIDRNHRTSISLYGYATSRDAATDSAQLSLRRAIAVKEQLARDLSVLHDTGVVLTAKGEGRLSNSVLASFRNVEAFAN